MPGHGGTTSEGGSQAEALHNLAEATALSSSTFFEGGGPLVLELRGRDITELANFQHHRIFNCGRHTVHTGPACPSRLLVPFIPRR